MGGKKSKPITSSRAASPLPPPPPTVTTATIMDIDAILSTLSGAVYPRQRTVENFLLVWLDATIEQPNREKCFVSLRGVINEVNFFTELNQCIQFLYGIDDDKIFVITSGSLGEQLVPIIHALPQIEGIYIFCLKKDFHEIWTKRWTKVKGIYTNIQLISEALKQMTRQCNEDSIGISFITVGDNISEEKLEELEPSFKYTQILKGILSDISTDETSIKILVDYCRDLYRENTTALAIISEFESDYRSHSPIWWYSRPCFIYQILNRALRTLEEVITLQIGFFIRDLHEQIEQLYKQQMESYQHREESYVAYRGQSLSKADAERLLNGENGLMSFDGFMFASTNLNVSLKYATDASSETDKIGVLFQITLNHSLKSIPFASIRGLSYHEMEEDILFSMHSVFRVNKITKIHDTKLLYQVDLQPVDDDDPELQILADLVRKNEDDEKGWIRIPNYLYYANRTDKAERFCTRLLEQTSDLGETVGCYCQLGYIKQSEKEYEEAMEYFEKAIEISEQMPPPNDFYLAKSYEYMSNLYNSKEEYAEAFSYEAKTLEIKEKSLPYNHPDLASAYKRIAGACLQMNNASNALAYLQKALDIMEKILPPNHLDLASVYQKIAITYLPMEDTSNALVYLQKALDIMEKTLPSNHPDLAEVYETMAVVYDNTEDYPKALELYQKTLEIQEKAVVKNYEDIVDTYDQIVLVHLKLEEYTKVMAFCEKALEIRKQIHPPEHPEIVGSYDVLAAAYERVKDYSSALPFRQKALEIKKQFLSPDDTEIIDSYQKLGDIYQKLEQYSVAISWYEQALDILQKLYPDNHPSFHMIYHEISMVYQNMKDFAKAIVFAEKTLEVWKAMPDQDKCIIGILHQRVGSLLERRDEYTKALVYYEKSIEFFEGIDITMHPDIVDAYNKTASAYSNVGNYARALSFYLKCLELQKQIDPNNEKKRLGSKYEIIGFMYKNVKEYEKAIEYYELAREAYLIEHDGDYIFMKTLEANIKFAQKKLSKQISSQ